MDVTLDGVLLDRKWNDEELSAISIQVAAFDGEVGAGTFPIPDYLAAEDIYGGQQIKVVEGSVVLVNGTVDDQQRERHGVERIITRVQTFTVRDANALLYGYRNANWIRPAESDRARWLASAAKYNPSFDTSMVLGTGLVTMPAKTYDSDGGAGELIGDTIELAGKTVFVEESISGTRILHVHTLIEGNAAGIEIDDTFGAPNGTTVFYPGNPVRSKTPADLFNNIRARGTGVTALLTDPTSISVFNRAGLRHEKLIDFPDAKTQGQIDAYAAAALAEGRNERVTYEVTIGPLDGTALALFRGGQILAITSQALGLVASAQRISHVTLTVFHGKDGKPLPGLWDARLELGRPLRTHGPRRSSPAPVATAPGGGGGPGPGGAPCGPFDDWPGSDTVNPSGLCDTAAPLVDATWGVSEFNATHTIIDGVATITQTGAGSQGNTDLSLAGLAFDAPWEVQAVFAMPETGTANTMDSGSSVSCNLATNSGSGFWSNSRTWQPFAGSADPRVTVAQFTSPTITTIYDAGSGAQTVTISLRAPDGPSMFGRIQTSVGFDTGWVELTGSAPGTLTDLLVGASGGGDDDIPFPAIMQILSLVVRYSTTCVPVAATNELGSDWTITDTTGLTELGSSGGSMFVRWADQVAETAISFVANRLSTMSPGYLLPTLGAGQTGSIVFTMPFSFIDNKPAVSDDTTAFASVRMKITLPGGNTRGVGAYIHDGLEYLEVYNGASWSTTGGLSETKTWNVDTIYTLKLDMSQARVVASVTGGPEIDLTALAVWTPGTASGTIDWEISVVGNVVYGSTVTVLPIDIRSVSSTGVVIPGFWCSAPEQTQVPGTFIANGDGTTTLFYTTTPYLAGSLAVTVDGIAQHAIETDPATGAFTLEFAPVEGEALYASWAYSAAPPPPEGGFDTTGTRVWSTLVPSLASDQGSTIQSFIETQAAAGTVAAFNPGTYRVDARRFFSSTDNIRIWGPGVTFKRVSTSAGLHEILEFSNCNDLLIQGLTIEGPATDSDIRTTNYSREDNYGIGLYGVRRATFRGCHMKNVWGDGFYYARSDDGDAATLCDTLLWEDCDVIVSGRNGWSHVTGSNITLRRCLARTVALHGFDVEPNRSGDRTDNLTIDDFGASDFDAANSSAGPGYPVVVGPGPPSQPANGVTIRRLRTDRARLYIIGPSSGNPHVNVTVTGTRANTSGSGNVQHVSGWVNSDNDGLSLPASGTVT